MGYWLGNVRLTGRRHIQLWDKCKTGQMLSSDSLDIPEGIQQGTLRIEPHAVTPAIAALRAGDLVDFGDERVRIVKGERDDAGGYTFRVVRARDVFIVEPGGGEPSPPPASPRC